MHNNYSSIHWQYSSKKKKKKILPIYNLYISAGRRHGRQMDDYVDDLFENVLDQGPPVSDARSN